MAALIAATLVAKRRSSAVSGAPGWVPKPFLAGVIAFMASSLFIIIEFPGWWRIAGYAAVAALFFVVVAYWSRRAQWSIRHAYALTGGAILTYAWLGAVMEPESGPKTSLDHIGTGITIAIVMLLFAKAAGNISQKPATRSD